MFWSIAMFLATLTWAGAFIAGKVGVLSASPLALTYFRFLVAGICLYGYARARRIPLGIRWRDWGVMIQLGLVGMIGYHLLFFAALKSTTAIRASMIMASNPLMIAILAAFLLREKLGRAKVACILTALAGVLLTISRWHPLTLVRGGVARGDLLMLVAVLCWSMYAIIVRRHAGRFDPVVTTFYSFVTCVILLTPFEAWEVASGASHIRPDGWLAIVYMGVFPTFFGYTVMQQGIKHLGLSRMALFVNLVPVLAMFMAVLMLHETFFPLNAVSAAMIIAAVMSYSLLAPGTPKPLARGSA
jgi:drug/metabolite transporter (DMT)-like permease